jgi:hypothetical protein
MCVCVYVCMGVWVYGCMKIVEQTSPVRAESVVEHVMIVGVVGIVEQIRWGGMIELRML